jgi:DNA-binding transcriptional MerR regulator
VKISQLCEQAGVTPSTLKYYVREGLVAEGSRTGANQTSYNDSHVERVRLVRALLDTGGLSIAAARQVVSVLDSHIDSLPYAFEAAQHALGDHNPNQLPASGPARARIRRAAEDRRWLTTDDNPGFEIAARVLDGYAAIGFEPSQGYLEAYAEAAEKIAKADLASLRTRDNADSIAELMVVGTVLGDALVAGFRRLAQQNETSTVFPLSRAKPEGVSNA